MAEQPMVRPSENGQNHLTGQDHQPGHARPTSQTRRIRRDRRGRGLRGDLLRGGTGIEALDEKFGLPEPLPDGRTRLARFHYIVDAAFEQLEHRWAAELSTIDYQVEDVPRAELLPASLDGVDPLEEPVRLAVTVPASGTGRSVEPSTILLFRRPIEARSRDRADLAELIFDILVHELSDLLGRTPEEIDPEGHGGLDEEP